MREVQAYDLELYAINSGSLYEKHKRLGKTNSLVDWVEHVRNCVRPKYSCEIEHVYMSDKTAVDTARRLMEYYARHVRELDE